MKKTLNIFLVDDHNLFREGLRFLLENQPEIHSITEASSGEELLNQLDAISPDMILMDIEMPGMNGIEATAAVLKKHPETKIIALSMHANENYYSEMINAGARGFLLKNSRFDEVMQAINDVKEGKNYFSPEIMEVIIKHLNRKSRKNNNELTEREIEILYNICKGFSNQEIADLLHISRRTVDKHREHILIKTESKNTAALVIYAIRNNVFEV